MAKKVICGITITWKKIVGVIAALLGIGTLTSCYGMPSGEFPGTIYTKDISGTVMGDIDGDGIEEPVPGIRVESYSNCSVTDYQGKFEVTAQFYDGVYATLDFIDVDGSRNGSFNNVEDFEIKYPDYSEDVYDIGTIKLTKKTE